MNEVGREWLGGGFWEVLWEVNKGVEGEHFLASCWEEKDQPK